MSDVAKLCSAPQRILLVLMGSVGDVVRGLTVAEALKKNNPQHIIAWVVEPAAADLVRMCSAVDLPIIFRRSWKATPHCLREIRAFRPTLALDLQRHFKSGFFAFSSGAKVRVGFHPRDSKEGNFLFQTMHIEKQPEQLNKILHYWEFLKVIGVPVPEAATVSLKIPDSDRVSSELAGKDFVSIILGTRWESKRWPIEGYQKLLELLRRDKKNVALLGGKEDVHLAKKLVSQMPECINLTGQTSIAELALVLERSSAVIGPDSGPAHIAAALGVPHITLFGPTSAGRTAPLGYKDLVVQSHVPCAGCYRKRCPGLNTLCMRSISPQSVYEKVRSFL